MHKKKLGILIGISVAFLLLMGAIYWFYLANPTSFPADEEIKDEVNSVYPQASAQVIQDTLALDDRHVLVPFISEKDDYGLSYWVWNKHKWRVAVISSKGTPRVWKIDPEDPSTYYIVWNIHPEDKVTTMDYYLLRDRDYHITSYGSVNQKGMYYSKIQLRAKAALNASYGAMKLPEEWAAVLSEFNQMGKSTQSDMFTTSFFPENYFQFGWIPSDQDGVELSLDRSFNGNQYNTDVSINLDFIRILNEIDLEVPATP